MNTLLDITLHELGIKHTRLYAETLERDCPYRKSLWALTRMLDRFNVAHYPCRLADKSKITELQRPFIAEVSKDCVVVTDVAEGSIHYTSVKGHFKTEKDKFIDAWSGVTVLLQADETSAEPDYADHKQRQAQETAEKTIAIVLGGMAVLAMLFLNGLQWIHLALVGLSSIGLYLSWLLLNLHTHSESKAATKICSLFKGKSSCVESRFLVLDRYDLSELGIVFFGCNLLLSLFSPLFIISPLSVVTLAAIPFTLWSIGYQRFHQHKWCPLCLMVQGVVWLQFAAFCFEGTFVGLHLDTTFILATIVLTASYILATYCVHRGYASHLRLRETETRLNEANKLKFEPKVWSAMSQSLQARAASSENSLLVFGSYESDKPTITVLGNPLCSPCARMHHRLQTLLNAGFTIEYVYSYFLKDYEHLNRQIITSYLKEGAENTWASLNRWYRNNPSPAKQFYEDTGITASEREAVDTELLRHEQWVERTGIHATPFILVNGYELPPHYQIEDLLYLF